MSELHFPSIPGLNLSPIDFSRGNISREFLKSIRPLKLIDGQTEQIIGQVFKKDLIRPKDSGLPYLTIKIKDRIYACSYCRCSSIILLKPINN